MLHATLWAQGAQQPSTRRKLHLLRGLATSRDGTGKCTRHHLNWVVQEQRVVATWKAFAICRLRGPVHMEQDLTLLENKALHKIVSDITYFKHIKKLLLYDHKTPGPLSDHLGRVL